MEPIANLIGTVHRAKYGSRRQADRDIEAVRFPIQVAAKRSPEIVEIRNVISYLIRNLLHFVRFANHALSFPNDAMSAVDELLHRAIHALHCADRCLQRVGLLEHVVHAVFLKLHNFYLAGVLHTEQKRYRSVFDRGSLGPSYSLNLGNAWNGEDALC